MHFWEIEEEEEKKKNQGACRNPLKNEYSAYYNANSRYVKKQMDPLDKYGRWERTETELGEGDRSLVVLWSHG